MKNQVFKCFKLNRRIRRLINTGVIVFLIKSFAWATTFEVCAQCEWTSIRSAIEASSDGDLILVKSGSYFESQILVNKSLHIKGEGNPVIDGKMGNEIMTIISPNVTIEGLQIQNVATSYLDDRAGIRVKKTSGTKIINNVLHNTFFGIYIEHSKDVLIENNRIEGNAKQESSSGNAIHLWYSKDLTIRGNHVLKHRDGIYLEFVDNSSVSENISERNLRYGLHFMFSNKDEYHDNQFIDNGAGVAVMFSKFINMSNNRFEKNWGKSSYGLLLKEIYDAEIYDNHFIENTIAIFVEGSTRINYYRNEFRRNGWAVKMIGGCVDNSIHENNFHSNSFDLTVGNNINGNQFDGNFWSDYSGYDLDRNGIGDVPYRPVKLFNYVINKTPEAMVLLRSLFVDLINFSEKVSPVFTPDNVIDSKPKMKAFKMK